MKIPTVQNTLQTVILTPLHFSAIHISLILYHSGDFLLECLKFYIRRAIHSLTTKGSLQKKKKNVTFVTSRLTPPPLLM